MGENGKLRLDVGALSVDSFTLGDADGARGTVAANEEVTAGPSCRNTCTTCQLSDACGTTTTGGAEV